MPHRRLRRRLAHSRRRHHPLRRLLGTLARLARGRLRKVAQVKHKKKKF